MMIDRLLFIQLSGTSYQLYFYVHYSLFTIHYSLFTVPYPLLPVPCPITHYPLPYCYKYHSKVMRDVLHKAMQKHDEMLHLDRLGAFQN